LSSLNFAAGKCALSGLGFDRPSGGDFDIDKQFGFTILRFPSQISERCTALSAVPDVTKKYGGVPEWLKGTGCKPVGYAYVGSNPTPTTKTRGKGELARA
jgi:hypothetical protein